MSGFYRCEIQKRMADGQWLIWSHAPTAAQAIEDVKGYCLAPEVSFRVVDPQDAIVFERSGLRSFPQPVEVVSPAVYDAAMRVTSPDGHSPTTVEVELRSDTFSGWGIAAVDAARTLKPRVGDKLTFKILTQDRLQVWVDRA